MKHLYKLIWVVWMATPTLALADKHSVPPTNEGRTNRLGFGVGMIGGLGWVTMGGDSAETEFGRSVPMLGSAYGLALALEPHQRIAVRLELLRSAKGAAIQYPDGTDAGPLEYDYLDAVLLGEARILTSGVVRPYALAGLNLGYILKTERIGPTGNIFDLTDDTTTFDIGVVAGAGLAISATPRHELTLDARVDIGLRTTDSLSPRENRIYNRTVMFMLGYRFWVVSSGGRAGRQARDSDHDGVRDNRDRCPDVAEDIDDFQDDDGCPDGYDDGDGDGVDDEHDRCQGEMEDLNGYRDDDGCADADDDVDEDGIMDPGDKCLDKPGYWTEGGCPFIYQSIVVQHVSIVLVGDARIGFVGEGRKAMDALDPAALAVLDEIAQALKDHPKIKRLEIEVYSAKKGRVYVKLSQKQADVVRAYLVAQGVEETRLRAVGYGNEKPSAEPVSGERTAADHVEFMITPGAADE